MTVALLGPKVAKNGNEVEEAIHYRAPSIIISS